MDPLGLLMLMLLGLAVGVVGAMLGVGGGIIVVPLLILAFNFEAQKAIGTSITTIVFTALSATMAYYRQRRIDWKLGAITAAITGPAASLGAYATKLFTSKTLAFIFALALAIVAIRMLQKAYSSHILKKNLDNGTSSQKIRSWRRRLVDSKGEIFEYSINIRVGTALLFLGGFVSGFFGVGGGIVVVPVFDAVMGIPMHLAVATSMFTMIFNSTSGLIVHIFLGNVVVEYAAPLALGIIFGTQIGAKIARSLRSRILEGVFAVAILIVAIWMMLSRLI